MNVFDLVFKLDEVRIGTNSEGNFLEALKYGQMYVIPFSTWKGVFRSVTEMLEESQTNLDDLLKTIDQFNETGTGKDTIWRVTEEIERKFPGLGGVLRDVLNPEETVNKETIREIAEAYMNPVHRLYGHESFSGALIFSDSVLQGERGVVTRTSIDRKTGKAKEDMLFSEEVVYPGHVRVRVVLHDVPDFAMKAWIRTLEFMKEVGVGIGSGRSRRSWAVLDDEDSRVARIRLRTILDGGSWVSLRDWLKESRKG